MSKKEPDLKISSTDILSDLKPMSEDQEKLNRLPRGCHLSLETIIDLCKKMNVSMAKQSAAVFESSAEFSQESGFLHEAVQEIQEMTEEMLENYEVQVLGMPAKR